MLQEAVQRAAPEVVTVVSEMLHEISLVEHAVILGHNMEYPGKWIRGIRVPKNMQIIPENIPAGLVLSGCALLDCNGLNVLGKDANDIVPIDLPPDRPITPEVFGITPSLMVRVWNRVNGEPKEFLGRVIVPAEELLNPETGIRAYNLEIDPTIDKMQANERRKQEAIEKHKQKDNKLKAYKKPPEPFEISGKLFLRISAPKSDENDIPIQWRIEIVKASKIACVHNAQKSSPYCEILWRGMAEKDGEMKEHNDWLSCGITKTKERSLDPQFKRNDNNTYEFPPYWTACDVDGRGLGREPLQGGAWVGRNLIPKDDPAAGKIKLSALDRIRLETQAAKEAAEKIVLERRENNDENIEGAFMKDSAEDIERARIEGLVKTEVSLRLESYRFALDSEEAERKSMSIEDNLVRKHLIEIELLRCKKYLDEQVAFSRQYSRIVYNIIDPPLILERLQFCMGYSLNSGGTKVMCQDPATRAMLEVISIPLLYPEDEEELQSQIIFMLGRHHPNLTKFIDYSIHQVDQLLASASLLISFRVYEACSFSFC